MSRVFFGPQLPNLELGANSWQIYIPGLLVQLALFGAAFVGFSSSPTCGPG